MKIKEKPNLILEEKLNSITTQLENLQKLKSNSLKDYESKYEQANVLLEETNEIIQKIKTYKNQYIIKFYRLQERIDALMYATEIFIDLMNNPLIETDEY